MNPMCTLRYSATHADKHHMLYRLDAVDAYERKLVKQIEVAAAGIEGGHNKPYVRLVAVSSKRGAITAKVELDVQTASGVQRQEVTVQDGDNLEQTTGRAVYNDCRVGEIRVEKGKEFLELRVPGGEHYLKRGEAYGDVEPLAVQREMIRRTIKEHLDKELRLAPQGIKVLTLFFIDAVERYRKYDADGNPVKGRLRHHLRGRVSPTGQAPRLPELVQGSGRDDGRRRGPRRLFLHRQEEDRDEDRRSLQGHPRRHQGRRRHLQPHHAEEGEVAEFRDAS